MHFYVHNTNRTIQSIFTISMVNQQNDCFISLLDLELRKSALISSRKAGSVLYGNLNSDLTGHLTVQVFN